MSNDDAAEFISLYNDKLDELTFASKPIINALTMLADEHAIFADITTATIVQHISQSITGEQRLPYLYLIDSIIKNIVNTTIYRDEFSNDIITLFIDTYRISNANIKQSL